MENTSIYDLNIGNGISIFGLFDGHEGIINSSIGREVAQFVKAHFIDTLSKSSEFQNSKYSAALTYTFLQMDELLRTPDGQKELHDISVKFSMTPCEREPEEKIASDMGCAACVVLIVGDDIYIANVGDCRCLICKKGITKTLTKIHKPETEIEKARIIEAGGTIEEGKISGVLTISRTIGDLEYKKNPKLSADKQIIISNPDIAIEKIDEETELLVITCNGVWKCYKDDRLIYEFRSRVWDKTKNKPLRVKLSKVISEVFDSVIATDLESDGTFFFNQ